ncbi:hypothetical protein [Sphingobacterium sp. MYb388]|uniref:hypothetical protein n=1 Tax=Sphingobacterium sp. MYb388 TaxID=2745437 RepID=UPI0030953C04
MKPTSTYKPTWYLGLIFVDSDQRSFEVVKTIFGDISQPMSYCIDLDNDWSIESEPGDHLQTAVGFRELNVEQSKLIIQQIEKMDLYERTGHLKKI